MTNYTHFHKFNENDELLWCVGEKQTKQVVAEFCFEDDALEYSLFLEHGGAFDGFTPSFILRKSPISDINGMFESKFA